MKPELSVALVVTVMLLLGVTSAKSELPGSSQAVIQLLGPTSQPVVWRENMARALLAYCTDVSQRVPRNTPKEDEWVRQELMSGDLNRFSRAVASVEHARATLTSTFNGCIEKAGLLVKRTGKTSLEEVILWVKLAINFQPDLEKAALQAGIVHARNKDELNLVVLDAVRFKILESAVLPLLEGPSKSPAR